MKNKYEINNEVTIIYCNYKNEIYNVIIDTKNLEMIKSINVNWKVRHNKSGIDIYAQQYLGRKDGKDIAKTVTLKKLIGSKKYDCRLVYKSDNRLDNRECNIVPSRKSNLVKIEYRGDYVDAKKCVKCNKIKPLFEYNKQSSCYLGLQTDCRECDNKAKKERYYKYEYKSKYSSEYAKSYYQKNKEKIKNSSKSYYLSNQRLLIEKQRNYYYNHKDIYDINSMKRRTTKKSLPYLLTNKDKYEILMKFNNLCPFTNDCDIHLDHFIPLSIGHGGTYVGNLIPLSSKLNLSKHNNNPFEWVKEKDVDVNNFYRIVEYLANLNDLTTEEYKEFVYWCFDNPRTLGQIKADGNKTSLELYKEDYDKYIEQSKIAN